ncbi:hypothetical protein JQ607_12465 [Bradyrhizobium liaoningense]|nr:hypothetical protein [Bradyrhizobium liaoningense]
MTAVFSATLPAAAQKLEDQVVIATTGGLMGNTLAKYFYEPFNKAKKVEVVPVAIEVPDQWARAKAMQRTGKIEFDIVTATGPDLVGRADMLEKIDCAKLPNVQKFGVSDACQPYGVARTTGALAVVKEGVPAALSWDQAIRDTGYMAILKGAPDVNAAMAYLDFFYASSEAHVPFMRAVNYATASKSAIELMKPEERNLYATSPENYEKLVKPDFAWIGEHRNELRERWMAWLTR